MVGTWESTEIKIGSPTMLQIASWEGDGYSISNLTFQEKTEFKLDGKEYTPGHLDPAPVTFNVIDASNLLDFVGLIDVLTSAIRESS